MRRACSGYREPFWYDAKLESFDVSRRRYQSSVDLAYYLATEPPKSKSQPRPAAQPAPKKHEYIHVMDGGLADNIGARGVLEAYLNGFIDKKLADGKI